MTTLERSPICAFAFHLTGRFYRLTSTPPEPREAGVDRRRSALPRVTGPAPRSRAV
jgi:hypothetical protein